MSEVSRRSGNLGLAFTDPNDLFYFERNPRMQHRARLLSELLLLACESVGPDLKQHQVVVSLVTPLLHYFTIPD